MTLIQSFYFGLTRKSKIHYTVNFPPCVYDTYLLRSCSLDFREVNQGVIVLVLLIDVSPCFN